MNVHPSKKSKLIFVTTELKEAIENSKEFISKLGFGNEIVVQQNEANISSNAISIIKDKVKLFIPFEELVDIEEEKARLENEKTRLKSEVARGEKMLSNPGFVNKAPKAKIEEEQAKLAKYKQMLTEVEERLSKM